MAAKPTPFPPKGAKAGKKSGKGKPAKGTLPPFTKGK